jgi:hypothetical protein
MQIAVVVGAFAGILDSDFATIETLGTIYGIGVALAIGVIAWRRPATHRWLFRAASVGAALAALLGVAAWASLAGRPLILEPAENVRIWSLILADLVFTAWLIVVWRAKARDPAPAVAWLAAFAAVRGILEVLLFLPSLAPAAVPAPEGGDSSPILYAFAVAGLVLAGFVIVPLWELAVARWLVRQEADPV